MNKTPVSILQEMMIKDQTVPNYELVHDGGGSHLNTFTYKVTCNELTAIGSGRCKKDAKHEAAKAMLETIVKHRGYPQLPASPTKSPVRTPLPPTVPVSQRIPLNVPFLNAIGSLQDICAENNLEEPLYHLISDVGPPHARVFMIECIVATFREEGTGTTKKQAKHEAAKKMLHRINDLVADLKIDEDESIGLSEESRRKEIIANEIAMARYPLLSRLAPSKKVNLGLRISTYHSKLKNSVDEEMREELKNKLLDFKKRDCSNISEELFEQRLAEVKEFLALLNLEISYSKIECDSALKHICVMRLNTCPDIVRIAIGESEVKAKFSALKNIINTIILYIT